MKITLKNTPEQVELIKAMGQKDPMKSLAAQESFAALLSPTIGEVLQQANTLFMYRDFSFNEDEDPSFPLELFQNVPEGYFTIWSQSMPGGLPTNTVHQPIEEIKFTTYRLDSAISYLKKYARRPRLDVVAKALERLAQEILVKQNRIGWSVVLAALANATHKSQQHVVRAQTSGRLSLDDMNKFMTMLRRIHSSWTSGTPTEQRGRLTDLVISPEVMEFIRSFAYNPVNTKGPNGQTPTGAADGVMLSETERAGLFGSATQQIFNVNLVELLELGVGQKYNTLFGAYAGSTTYDKYATSGSSPAAFNPATEQIVIGVDATQDFAYRALGVNEDYQSAFTLQPDNQFLQRSEKLGLYGFVTEGRMVLNTYPLVGLIL